MPPEQGLIGQFITRSLRRTIPANLVFCFPDFGTFVLSHTKNRATALNNAVGIIPESFGGPLGCGPQGAGICHSVREQPRQKQIPDYDTRE